MPPRQLTRLDKAASTYVRLRAEQNGWMQIDLARQANIPPTTLHRYWLGQRSMPLGVVGLLIVSLGDTLEDGLDGIQCLYAGQPLRSESSDGVG